MPGPSSPGYSALDMHFVLQVRMQQVDMASCAWLNVLPCEARSQRAAYLRQDRHEGLPLAEVRGCNT